MHFGRYGSDAESGRLQQLFVGYRSLVRGYDAESFSPSECRGVAPTGETCPQFSRLVGSRYAVANVELRIPLLGTDQLGLISFPYLPVEIAPFIDAGVAWTSSESPSIRFDRDTPDRVPVVSAGVTSRVNLLGAAVIEIFWAHPYQRPGKKGYWGFQIIPGW
jgi:outer membrane protein assembly factor BamA